MGKDALDRIVPRNRLVGSTIERYTRNGSSVNLSQRDIQSIIDVTRRGFGTSMGADDIRNHILPVQFLYVASWHGNVVGFASSEVREGKFYLAGVAVDRERQEFGLATDLTRAVIEDAANLAYTGFWTRTQNPLVERTISRVLGDLRDEEVVGNWSIDRTLLEGHYGHMLTDTRPLSRNPELSRIYGSLDYSRGDAFRLDVNFGHS
jgi:GNAT superfamily N-acetyltransferase